MHSVHTPRSHRLVALLVTAVLAGAPASAFAAGQDLRSPDARDAARAAAQDLRSPDTRDVARGLSIGASTSAPVAEAPAGGVDDGGVPLLTIALGALGAVVLAGGAATAIASRHHPAS